jgi:PAS domain-containing protein
MRARRVTSPVDSDDRPAAPGLVTALFVVVALIGWAAVVVIAFELRKARGELHDARRLAAGDERVSLTDAITDERRDAEDRVAHAEAVQHWLLLALDESTDAIVVVDRIGREVVRNAAARRFAGARKKSSPS